MNIYNNIPFDLINKIDNLLLQKSQKYFNNCLVELKFLVFVDKIIKNLYYNYKFNTCKFTILAKKNKIIILSYNKNYILINNSNYKKIFYINLEMNNIFNIRKHKNLIYYLYQLFKKKFILKNNIYI
tara:strand:+ start:1137 stop:1517 length:381 start_codon:yes stop_codon:yes gene_type:complete